MEQTQIFELCLRDDSGNNGKVIESILKLPPDKAQQVNQQLSDRGNAYYWRLFVKPTNPEQ